MKASGSMVLTNLRIIEVLALAANHHDDLGLLLRIPPLRVDERDPAVDVIDDRLGHLLVVVRDDEDLARLLAPGHDHIDRIAHDRRHHVAVDHGADAHAHQHGRGDDDEIGVDEYLAVADRAVFVDDHGHDVRTARRSALREAERDAGAGQNAAHDDRQQVIDAEEIALGKHLLPEVHAEGDDHHAIDGLDAEIPPHDKSGDEQQDGVDDEDHRTDLEIQPQHRKGVAQHERQTGRTAADTARREDAADPAERIHQHADSHQDILLDGFQHDIRGNGFHSDGFLFNVIFGEDSKKFALVCIAFL